MAFTLCTSGAATIKAGTNVSTTILQDATALDKFSDSAEGRIVAETRRDWVDSFASVDTGTKGLLDDVCSSLIALQMIQFDLGSYNSQREAETLLDVQDSTAQRGLKILRDFKSNTIKSP